MTGPRLVAVDGNIVGELGEPRQGESIVRADNTFAVAFYEGGVVASHNGQFGSPALILHHLAECMERYLADAEACTMGDHTGPGFSSR